MKIISPNKEQDFYDVGQHYGGHDDSIILDRRRPLEKPDKELVEELIKFKWDHFVAPTVIFFCGMAYPVFTKWEKEEEVSVWNEDLQCFEKVAPKRRINFLHGQEGEAIEDKEILVQLMDIRRGPRRGIYWGSFYGDDREEKSLKVFQKFSDKKRELFEKHVRESMAPQEIGLEIFKKIQYPFFVLDTKREEDKRFHIREWQITDFRPLLRNYGLQQVLDPYVAYQLIEQTIPLLQEEPSTDLPRNEKQFVQAKGLHPTKAFRK